MRRVAVALLAVFAVVGLALSAAAQDQMKSEMKKATKQARWEGTITRSDKDASTLTVRKSGGNIEKVVHYDASTKWTHQEKGKVEPLEMAEVKDGDRVICLGKYDEKGEFHADRIDKRLPH